MAQSSFRAFFDAAATGLAPDSKTATSFGGIWQRSRKIKQPIVCDAKPVPGAAAARVRNRVRYPTSRVARPHLRKSFKARKFSIGCSQNSTLPTTPSCASWPSCGSNGASVQEIASELNCTTRTVQRKLHIIERLWAQSKTHDALHTRICRPAVVDGFAIDKLADDFEAAMS